MKLHLIGHDHRFEVVNVCTLFFPREGYTEANGKELTVLRTDNGYEAIYAANGGEWHAFSALDPNGYDAERRALKQAVYRALSDATGISSPWGILTGVRPVRFYEKLLAVYGEEASRRMEHDYAVRPDKIELCAETLRRQARARAANLPHTAALYLSVPFCPSRCKYCSFVSQVTQREGGILPDYLKLLCEEIPAKTALAAQNGDTITSVYVGGGTPTVLDAEQLDELLRTVNANLSQPVSEFTVEAGRPDTLTPEKLSVMERRGVTRISVNPQTLNDDVLLRVGRKHTAEDFFNAYRAAKQTKMQINVDLIAGLPGDTPASFANTVDRVIALDPENITVHTLYLKRAADYGAADAKRFTVNAENAETMVSYARSSCAERGYYPYYLYRQKNTVGNLENVGYAKNGTESFYNIYMMDDLQPVYGAGANAMSKTLTDGTVSRKCNTKFPLDYVKNGWK